MIRKSILALFAASISLAWASTACVTIQNRFERNIREQESIELKLAIQKNMQKDFVKNYISQNQENENKLEDNTSKELEEIVQYSKFNNYPVGYSHLNQEKFNINYTEGRMSLEGLASFYTRKSSSTLTATGAPFYDNKPTIALNPGIGIKLPAIVKITSNDTGKEIYAVANDLGPFDKWTDGEGNPHIAPHKSRIADLSVETRNRLGLDPSLGVYKIKLEIIKEYNL